LHCPPLEDLLVFHDFLEFLLEDLGLLLKLTLFLKGGGAFTWELVGSCGAWAPELRKDFFIV
jgi:hypothetical protein